MQGYFNDIVKAQNEMARTEALADWHREMSGTNASRIGRFGLTGDRQDDIRGGRAKDKGTGDFIDLVLTTPDYAARHMALMDSFSQTRQRADDLSERIDILIGKAKARYEASLENAVTLPDGRKAFLDTETGIAWADDNTRLDDDLTAGIDWNGKTTLQEHGQNGDALASLEGHKAKVDGITVDLADGQNALNDTKDGGLDADDFDELDRNLDEARSELEALENDVHQMELELSDTDYNVSSSPASSMVIPDFET